MNFNYYDAILNIIVLVYKLDNKKKVKYLHINEIHWVCKETYLNVY